MTNERRLERDLPTILGDLAIAPYPDYIDDVLATTAQRRQRPAWTFPERWLPMDITLDPVEVRAAPWRRVALVIALIALLVTVLATALMNTAQRLPAPFGPARNGAVVYADDGDLWISDSIGVTPALLLSGPETDSAVRVSPDGRMIAFLREQDAGHVLVVADIDGRTVRQLTAEPFRDVSRHTFSPDGSMIALDHTRKGFPVVSVVAVEDGSMLTLRTGGVAASHPAWRPPAGDTLTFRGEIDGVADVYEVAPDGSGLRALGVPGGDVAFEGEDLLRPTWSPDGTRIAYHCLDRIDALGRTDAPRWQVHVVDMTTLEDRVVSQAPDPWHEDTEPAWSPDGRSLVVQRFTFEVNAWMAVLPADGQGPAVDLEHRSVEYPPSGWRGEFAPDGTHVIAYYDYADEALTFDPATGKATDLTWSLSELPTYQRLAP